MSPIAQPTFTADERVLCFHGPLIYEAKVRRPPLPPRARAAASSRRRPSTPSAQLRFGPRTMADLCPRFAPLASSAFRRLPQVLKVDHDKKDYGKEKLSGTLYYVHYKGWKASCVPGCRPSTCATLTYWRSGR